MHVHSSTDKTNLNTRGQLLYTLHVLSLTIHVTALHACHDLAWVAPSTLKCGDPLWVRDLFRASRALARKPNVMTWGAASTKLILLAYGKHMRKDLRVSYPYISLTLR